jgi:hypothetical protein
VDAIDPALVGAFWARALDLTWHAQHHGDRLPVWRSSRHRIWVNRVPEPMTVKNRVHWDVSVSEVQPLLDAGATLLRPHDDEIGWHIFADPEGNEFCVFVD